MATPAPVLYVNHVSAISGAEESLLALMGALDRKAWLPVLACPPGELAARARDKGVDVIPLPMTRFRRTSSPIALTQYAVAWVTASNQLRRIVQGLKPKLIHSNSATAHLYCASVADRAGVPSIWHSRDLRPLPFPARTLCRHADRIIAVSEAVADFLAAAGLTRPRVSRIYNGIDPDAWRARVTGKDVRAELHLAPEHRILLMAAQFAPWKRHEDAIRAMSSILKRAPQARLVLAGADAFGDNAGIAPSLRAVAAELAMQEQVIFAGYRDDLPDLMAASDLLLVPSDAEPFGRVAIEAMALGKPVVGTRAGGLPEVVRDGETGLLVVPRFPDSLADACLRLIENQTLCRILGEAGRRRVEACFHIRRTVEETQRLYESVLHPPLKWVRS